MVDPERKKVRRQIRTEVLRGKKFAEDVLRRRDPSKAKPVYAVFYSDRVPSIPEVSSFNNFRKSERKQACVDIYLVNGYCSAVLGTNYSNFKCFSLERDCATTT